MTQGLFKRGLLALVLIVVLSITVFKPVPAGATNDASSSGVSDSTVGGDDSYWTMAKKTADALEQIGEAAAKGGALGVVVVLSSWLVEYATTIDPFSNANVQKVGSTIRSAGTFIINLINIFYILVLLFIAISTIVGIERYSIQSLLPRLVVAILLTNFGIFFVYAIAQASQLLSLGLLGKHIGADIINAVPLKYSLAKTSVRLGIESAVTVATAGTAGLLVPIIEVVHLLLDPLFWFAAILLMTALILIFRIAGLWVLAIFAPLGVAAGVLPVTQRFSAMYWQKVLSYAFVAPVLIFFIRLAVLISASTTGGAVDSIGKLFGYFVTAFTLLIGIMVSRKMGVEVANFIIGAFEKGAKGIIGATVAYAKLLFVLGKTGAQAAFIFGTGGAGAGALAGKLGMSAATAKTTGQVLGAFGGNMKGTFGNGILGSIGGAFSKRGDEFGKWSRKKDKEEKDAKKKQDAEDAAAKEARDGVEPAYVNPVATESPTPEVQKTVEGAKKLEKDKPEKAGLIAEDFNAGMEAMQAATDNLEKSVVAFEMAKNGQVDKENIDDVLRAADITPGSGSDRERLIRTEASNNDVRVHPEWVVATSDEMRRNFVRGWHDVGGNTLGRQGKSALQDKEVGRAVGVQPDFDKILGKLKTRQQRENLGTGIGRAANDAAGKDSISDKEVLNLSVRAVRAGHDPFSEEKGNEGIFSKAKAGDWSKRPALRDKARAQIMGDHNNLMNLNPRAFRNVMSQPEMTPEVATAAMNDSRVEDVAKNLVVDYADTPSPAMHPDVGAAIRGNTKLAVDRMVGEVRRQGQELKEIRSSVNKAQEAAEAAGEAANEAFEVAGDAAGKAAGAASSATAKPKAKP